MKEFVEKLIGRLDEKIKENTNDDMSYKIPYFGLEIALNIVNELAEEHKDNDFCEWKADEKFNWFFKSPHERVGVIKEESGLFKFCPYCGKKIKVVEPKGE